MRFREFVREGDPQNDPSVLLTSLELLRQHAQDNKTAPVIPTNDLLALVKQPGMTFTYSSLVHAYKNDPAIKKLIKSFNKDTVTFTSVDGEDEFSLDPNSPDVDLGTDTVARMAHKALSKRN